MFMVVLQPKMMSFPKVNCLLISLLVYVTDHLFKDWKNRLQPEVYRASGLMEGDIIRPPPTVDSTGAPVRLLLQKFITISMHNGYFSYGKIKPGNYYLELVLFLRVSLSINMRKGTSGKKVIG